MPSCLYDYLESMGGPGVSIVQNATGRPTHQGPMIGIPNAGGQMTYVYGSDDEAVESAMDTLIQQGVTGRR